MASNRLERVPKRRHCDLGDMLAVCGVPMQSSSAHTLRTGHNLAGVWRNVDSRDQLVVSSQLVLQLKA